jgi:predicted acylesterase/phospholipase RssA
MVKIKYFFCLIFWSLNILFVKSKICNILSFSGGGSFGALEIGILERIKLPQYDIITGISAGGLNAGFLSYYNNNGELDAGIKNIKSVIENLINDKVFHRDIFNYRKKWSYYNTEPLNKTIYKNLKKNNLSKNPTLIGATDVNNGMLKLFHFEN